MGIEAGALRGRGKELADDVSLAIVDKQFCEMSDVPNSNRSDF